MRAAMNSDAVGRLVGAGATIADWQPIW